MPVDDRTFFSLKYVGIQDVELDYGMQELQLWTLVSSGNISAYIYVDKNIGIKHQGSTLEEDRFYKIEPSDTAQFGKQVALNLDPGHICKIWKLQDYEGKLDLPVVARRRDIRFRTEDIENYTYYRPVSERTYHLEKAPSDRRQRGSVPETTTKNLMKLVALLSHLYASKDRSCIIGEESINTSKLEKVILKEAERLGVDKKGLRSCRRKIAECLDEYDIEEVI